MPALQFTRDLRDTILVGRKSQTLRSKLGPGIIAGSRLTMLNGYRPGALFGHAIVSSVDLIARDALTEMDARLDGFGSLAELRDRLRAMKAPDRLWRICWRGFSPTPAIARLAVGP